MLSRRIRGVLCSAALAAACGSSGASSPALNSFDASVLGSDGGSSALPPGCVEDDNNPPATLECTGLYSNLIAKQVVASARPYTPAVPLWSDGAEKQRWIELPPGTTIDNSHGNEWSFPVGTKVWKEFARGGHRVETRHFHKVRSDRWLRGTYIWNADETAAAFSFGADLVLSDGPYHVPPQSECDDCHKGRTDRLLGFEQILLGLQAAQGVTLATLVAEGRLTNPPLNPAYRIPDDGTGMAADALGWLHVNCGISCHNENSNATAYPSNMFLRIDPRELESGSLVGWNALTTTVNVFARAPAFLGSQRIVPGLPDQSLIVRLAQTRGTNEQMPPIASRLIDDAGVATVSEWIRRLAPNAAFDAGVPPVMDAALADTGFGTAGEDAGTADAQPNQTQGDDAQVDAAWDDAQTDGQVDDAGIHDAQADDAQTDDAQTSDAPTQDAALDDAQADDAEAEPDYEPDASIGPYMDSAIL